MTYQEALNYLNQADKEGYFTPKNWDKGVMTKTEIITSAENLGARGDDEINRNEE